jgi:hypothetical protein
MRIKKAIVITLGGLLFLNLGLAIYLDEYCYQNSPREPNPAMGQIYPAIIHHGAHVYLTQKQKMMFDYWPLSWFALFIPLWILLTRWKDVFPPNKPIK